MPPEVKTGEMFHEFPRANSMFLVTANSLINMSGQLVMGAGAAKQLTKALPNAKAIFGMEIGPNVREYGVKTVTSPLAKNFHVGIFQTKYSPYDTSNVKLIARSAKELMVLLTRMQLNNRITGDFVVNMNYPGIGLGGLSENAVWPVLAGLPDIVKIWKRV